MARTCYSRSALLLQPLPKLQQTRQRFPVLLPIRRCLALNDVVNIADTKPLYFHATLPGIFESLNAIGREYEIQIERTVFQLDEVFPPPNLLRLRVRQSK